MTQVGMTRDYVELCRETEQYCKNVDWERTQNGKLTTGRKTKQVDGASEPIDEPR